MSSAARKQRRARSQMTHAPRPELKILPGGPATVSDPEVVTATPPAARQLTATMPVGKPPMVTTLQPKPRPSRRLAFFTLAFFIVLAGFASYNLRIGTSTQPMSDLFGRLERDYRVFGMEKYLEGKTALRAQVAKGLNEGPDSAAGKTARNIAAYLFPDLLSDDNFEKAQAQEFWAPIERAIESSPRSDESRQWLEELRAVLNEYEGVGRGAARLSPYAETTLHIFEALSEK